MCSKYKIASPGSKSGLTSLLFCLTAANLLGGVHQTLALQAERAHTQLLEDRGLLGLDARHSFMESARHKDDLGQTHVRFTQLYQGVPVWGSDYIVHMDGENSFLEGTDKLLRNIELDNTPSLKDSEALAMASRHLAPKGVFDKTPSADLIIYPIHNTYALAYHVQLVLNNPQDGLKEWEYIIDAHSGGILEYWSALQSLRPEPLEEGTGKSQYNGLVKISTTRKGASFELRDMTRGNKGSATAGLQPNKGECGGLNEANSDINACMVEFHARLCGGGTVGDKVASSHSAIDGGNWTIGEQVCAEEGKAMRYMHKPASELPSICMAPTLRKRPP